MEAPLSRTILLQEIRKMRFEEAYGGWQEKRLTQGEAAELLGMSERNFRRYVGRYEADGLNGLIDLRIEQVSSRRAPVDEVMRMVDLYQSRHDGWNVKHFHAWYRKDQVGARSYSWVKNALQKANAVPRAKGKGKHRRKRERRPLPGMMLHQDGSRHAWVAEEQWDLIVTMDDATGEHTRLRAQLTNRPVRPLRVVLKNIQQDVGVHQQHQSSARRSFISSSVRQRTSALPRTAAKRSLRDWRAPLAGRGRCSTTSPPAFTENSTGVPGSS